MSTRQFETLAAETDQQREERLERMSTRQFKRLASETTTKQSEARFLKALCTGPT